MSAAYERPVQTAPAEYEHDGETGEAVRMIEHFRQGERFYRIVWDLTGGADSQVIDEPPPNT